MTPLTGKAPDQLFPKARTFRGSSQARLDTPVTATIGIEVTGSMRRSSPARR